MEGLTDFALSNLSAIDTGAALSAHFGRLQPEQLSELTLTLGLTHSLEQAASLGKPFLVRLLVTRYERRTAQHEAISSLPLYPDEVTPWDAFVVPTSRYSGATPLALPKLNLQVCRDRGLLMISARFTHGGGHFFCSSSRCTTT
jgi:intron-binding protein aquarius